MRLALFIASFVLILDQVSKFVVVQWMNLKSLGEIEVMPPFLTFQMAWNRGVNFGLFANNAEIMRWALVALSLGVSVWLLVWARRMNDRLSLVFVGLIVGGALGNTVDRVIFGAVADFLNMSCCGINNPYAFNVADIAIFLGAFGLVLFSNKAQNNG